MMTYLLLLLLSGSLSSSVPENFYILVDMPKTWYEAESYCREMGSHLATIDDMGQMEAALKVVEGKYDDAVWIGLQKGERRWHWSLADKELYKTGERDNFIWGKVLSIHYCTTFFAGRVDTYACIYSRYSICFDGNKQGHEQYVLITTKTPWTVARDYCRTHHTDLASVRNEEESQILQEVAGGLEVWTGLFRDPWEWADQTYSSFRYWEAGQAVLTPKADGACGALLKSQSGRWGERSCEEAHPFLCYSSKKISFIKVKISTQDSELDLNDPAVHDDILEQIKQELSNRNVTDSLQLRWTTHPDGKVFIKESNRREREKSTRFNPKL